LKNAGSWPEASKEVPVRVWHGGLFSILYTTRRLSGALSSDCKSNHSIRAAFDRRLRQVRRVGVGGRAPSPPATPAPSRSRRSASGPIVLVRGSKHTWLGIQRRKRRALVRMTNEAVSVLREGRLGKSKFESDSASDLRESDSGESS
jgi:hypothetical protein